MRSTTVLSLALLLAACGVPESNSGDDTQAADMDVADQTADIGAPDMGSEDAEDASPSKDLGTDDVDLGQATVFERGPYNIGHRRFEITYDAETDPGRTIKLSVWYPTLADDGPPGEYLINYQRNEVIGDAEPAIDGTAPLLVFSHGNSSIAEQSYFMTEFWTTHGWVVVAPYHTGNTTFDDLDGISFESGGLRPQDITATLDAMYALDAGDPLAGKISDDVVMTGHSFGGFTTLAVTGAAFDIDAVEEICTGNDRPDECSFIEDADSLDLFADGFLDERIDVAIPQAPGFPVILGGLGAIGTPTLLMTGARDATLAASEHGDPIWEQMQGNHMRVDLRAGGHFTFSNMCDLIPSVATNDGCGDEFIPKERAYDVINAYSLAWARRVLWGDLSNDELLDGSDTRYVEDVKLSWKPGSDLQ